MILGSVDVMMLYLSYMVNILAGHYIMDTHGYLVQYRDVYLAGRRNRSTAQSFHIGKYSNTVLKHNFPACERNGVDQGIHNVLVHNHLLPFHTPHTMELGLVMHVQSGEGLLYLMRDYVMYNAVGKRYSIVHQYDRRPYIQYEYMVKVKLCISYSFHSLHMYMLA